MNKKIYTTPLVDQIECRMFSALCGSDGTPNPNAGETSEGDYMHAPKRRIF